jgi:hypothetical protein
LESDEIDDDENQELTAEAAKKEDKTMLGAKALKESDKKSEKLGASAFQVGVTLCWCTNVWLLSTASKEDGCRWREFRGSEKRKGVGGRLSSQARVLLAGYCLLAFVATRGNSTQCNN